MKHLVYGVLRDNQHWPLLTGPDDRPVVSVAAAGLSTACSLAPVDCQNPATNQLLRYTPPWWRRCSNTARWFRSVTAACSTARRTSRICCGHGRRSYPPARGGGRLRGDGPPADPTRTGTGRESQGVPW